MKLHTTFQTLAAALVSGTAGWWLGSAAEVPGHSQAAAPVASPAPVARAAARPAPAAAPQPMVAVLDGGNVTLRVEREPLEWVLAEIERQGGRAELPASGSTAAKAQPVAAAAVAPEACTTPAVATGIDTQKLLQAVRHGTEADRSAGLLQAREASLALPDDVLKQLYETDASEQVRLLAFEAYLEARGADMQALRSTLQAALYVPHAAIQREAQRRLDELAEAERIGAASPQTGP